VLADVPHLGKNLRKHGVNWQKITLPDDIVKAHSLPTAVVSVKYLKRLTIGMIKI